MRMRTCTFLYVFTFGGGVTHLLMFGLWFGPLKDRSNFDAKNVSIAES